MGCYAAVVALRSARHIVRSDPQARVLVLSVELSSLHLQKYDRLESLLAALQFGDGAAAALVTAESSGLGIDTPFAATLPESQSLIQRSEEHTSELQSLMRHSYAVFRLKKKTKLKRHIYQQSVTE